MARIVVDENYFNRVKMLQRKGLSCKEVREFVGGSEESVRRCMVTESWNENRELNRSYKKKSAENLKECEQVNLFDGNPKVETLLALILGELKKMNERRAEG